MCTCWANGFDNNPLQFLHAAAEVNTGLGIEMSLSVTKLIISVLVMQEETNSIR